MEDFNHAGYPDNAEAILLCELDGTREQIEEELSQAYALLKDNGAIELNVAGTEQERQKMWAGRKSAFPAVGRISPGYYCMDDTITGEHGVGVEKINHMCLQFTEGELTKFHAVKRAFDERGLLNPGKAVPTLQRCAKFGAVHVHQEKLSHPELERF